MKWLTHQVGAAVGATFLDCPWPAVCAACAGAIFPDVIDQKISRLGPSAKKRQKIFNRIHRGSSHWFGWWLLLFLLPLISPLPLYVRDILVGFAFGALSHVALDLLTPRGAPLLPAKPGYRVSLNLCSGGSLGEYAFLATLIAVWIFAYSAQVKSALLFIAAVL